MTRNEILKQLFSYVQEFDALSSKLRSISIEKGFYVDEDLNIDTVGAEHEELLLQWNEIKVTMDNLVEMYQKQLKYSSISRCPFTGEAVEWNIDDEGLDGLWWNIDNPIRQDIKAPSTFYAIDGAMKLSSNIEAAPFTVKPGPDIPYVLPRLLELDQVKAVISQLSIGEHTGFCITYFCDPYLKYLPRINEWGTDRYWESNPIIGDSYSPGRWVSLDPYKSDRDFDLKYWIQKGKLFWIKPNDPNLRLRISVTDCPFIDLVGDTRYKVIQEGKYEYENPIDYKFRSFDAFKSIISDEELKEIEEEIGRGDLL